MIGINLREKIIFLDGVILIIQILLQSNHLMIQRVTLNSVAFRIIYLPQNYICKTDAIRVVKPVIPFVIKSIKNNSNAEVKKVPQLKTKYQTNFNVAKNLFDGTADDLNYCLKNTKLAGMGQIFIDAQNKYGIKCIISNEYS